MLVGSLLDDQRAVADAQAGSELRELRGLLAKTRKEQLGLGREILLLERKPGGKARREGHREIP